jgi:hypothetical protein
MGSDLSFHLQKTEHIYHSYFSFDNFLNDKNPEFFI